MENRTLKAGLSPPRAEEKVGRAPHVATLLIDFPTDFKDRALPPLHLVALSARNSSGKPFGGGNHTERPCLPLGPETLNSQEWPCGIGSSGRWTSGPAGIGRGMARDNQ